MAAADTALYATLAILGMVSCYRLFERAGNADNLGWTLIWAAGCILTGGIASYSLLLVLVQLA